jgi:Uma2 family endonuclease
MAYPAIKYISAEEYLQMELDSVEKHEFFDGEIVAMAGNTISHNRIVNNLIGELHSFLKGKSCESYPSDFRVVTPLFDAYTYPDVSVVCGKTELKNGCFDTLTNPTVIIEVMSKTTEKNDRGYKYFYYLQIPSLKEYILIDSNSCHAEIIRVGEERNKWEIINIDGADGILHIESIDMKLPMAAIYDRVVV